MADPETPRRLTKEQYPCGCSAAGEGAIPKYCPIHGALPDSTKPCRGEVVEHGKVVCQCSHGVDGICGFHADSGDRLIDRSARKPQYEVIFCGSFTVACNHPRFCKLHGQSIELDAERTRREQAEAERDDLRRQVTAANAKWTALREWLAGSDARYIIGKMYALSRAIDAKEPQA